MEIIIEAGGLMDAALEWNRGERFVRWDDQVDDFLPWSPDGCWVDIPEKQMPIGMEITEFHYLMLYPDLFIAINRLDQEPVLYSRSPTEDCPWLQMTSNGNDSFYLISNKHVYTEVKTSSIYAKGIDAYSLARKRKAPLLKEDNVPSSEVNSEANNTDTSAADGGTSDANKLPLGRKHLRFELPENHVDSSEEWENPEVYLKDDPELKHKAKGKLWDLLFGNEDNTLVYHRMDCFANLVEASQRLPFISVEDGFDQDVWEGWTAYTGRVEKDCGSLAAVVGPNAEVKSVTGTTYRSTGIAGCRKGYTGSQNTFKCSKDGTWMGKLSCAPIICGPTILALDPHATAKCIGNTQFGGDVCVATCIAGYDGGKSRYSCNEEGNWDGYLACKRRDCGTKIPGLDPVAIVEIGGTLYGDKVNARCPAGYNGGPSTIVCGINGWEGGIKCIPKDCGPLGPLLDANAVTNCGPRNPFGGKACTARQPRIQERKLKDNREEPTKASEEVRHPYS